ncbi:1-acyl-sn-glycerol-3-phosphate acyltransferase [Peterkaempfera bronchialis]|uniref:1-acyl-sn-glycerol-3-phosphate acyltransferase n=1 Tax=Peterkaempfera bronchialis TaxID=2126346 RepID=A0A345T2C0_9ACTN|nr:1-acyl-sn-glycerol-3-phosphate acyltransferase [Peterkaempfera bronchialis]
MSSTDHGEAPRQAVPRRAGRSADTPYRPTERGAAVGRRIGIALARTGWRVRVLGGWRVPVAGPVILAANHANLVDGPLLMGMSPRPTHFLVKEEMFSGPVGAVLRGVGQIPVQRRSADRTAIGSALEVLKDGGVLGVFPEGTRGDGDFAQVQGGLAYLALRSGAPVVPVAVFGTGERGRTLGAIPPLRGRIDVVFGDPFDAGDGSRLRTRKAMQEASERVRTRLAGHLAQARELTGR